MHVPCVLFLDGMVFVLFVLFRFFMCLLQARRFGKGHYSGDGGGVRARRRVRGMGIRRKRGVEHAQVRGGVGRSTLTTLMGVARPGMSGCRGVQIVRSRVLGEFTETLGIPMRCLGALRRSTPSIMFRGVAGGIRSGGSDSVKSAKCGGSDVAGAFGPVSGVARLCRHLLGRGSRGCTTLRGQVRNLRRRGGGKGWFHGRVSPCG